MSEFPQSPADIIERIMQTARAAVPDSLSQDLRESLRNSLQEVISELDVVSREELEIQKQVLQKTRAKVDELERMLSELESQIGGL